MLKIAVIICAISKAINKKKRNMHIVIECFWQCISLKK